MTVAISTTDAINAEQALALAAEGLRRDARRKRNAGEAMRPHREWLRLLADEYEASAARIRQALKMGDSKP